MALFFQTLAGSGITSGGVMLFVTDGGFNCPDGGVNINDTALQDRIIQSGVRIVTIAFRQELENWPIKYTEIIILTLSNLQFKCRSQSRGTCPHLQWQDVLHPGRQRRGRHQQRPRGIAHLPAGRAQPGIGHSGKKRKGVALISDQQQREDLSDP